MRHGQCTLSCKHVCGYATNLLVGALSSIGWVTGAATVEPLLLVQLLVRAGAERRSLEAIALLAQDIPCAQTIRNALAKLLPKTTAELRPVIVAALHQRLPKTLKRRPRTMAIDMHNKPYYGDKKTPGTYRGQPKASTKTFFAYATLLVIRKGQTYTVGLVSIVNGEELTGIIDQLLAQAASQGLRPRRLLLDRGFYAAKVMLHLQQRLLPFVMPMIRRGKAGQTKNACTGTAPFFVKGRRGWAKYHWEARLRDGGRKGARTPVTTDVCMVPPATPRRPNGKGTPLVFACYGMKQLAPTAVATLYRKRFRIETSYRQMREGLAMTCSKNPVYRLLLVLIALVLRNLWVWLHWTRLACRGPNGERVLRLALMRGRRMLHCLVRYLDYKLGIPKNIAIPNPAAPAA
jgi:Transposase DDE domain